VQSKMINPEKLAT